MVDRPIGNAVASRQTAHEEVYKALLAVTEERLEEKALKESGKTVQKHVFHEDGNPNIPI